MDYKKIIEILLIPIILTIFGIYFTRMVSKNDQDTNTIKVAFEVTQSISDDDINKTLMCQKIINQVLVGDQYRKLDTIINDYISAEIKKAVKNCDMDTLVYLKNAIQNNGNISSIVLLNKNIKVDSINRYEKSRKFEKEAFGFIISNNRDSAIDRLVKVENIFPTFHTAREIRLQLLSHKNIDNNVRKYIVENCKWRAPKLEIDSIRKQIK